MALTLPIKDPRVKIIPTARLTNFIKTLKDCNEMPENVLKIYQNFTQDKSKKATVETEYRTSNLSETEQKLLESINSDRGENANFATLGMKPSDELNSDKLKSKYQLTLNDIYWINNVIKENAKTSDEKIYLHELLEGSSLVLPKNEIHERNPVLEERCKKLRAQQERYQYNKMTKFVDVARRQLPEDTISYQIKQINKQLIGVAQFLFSVAAGFAFGFIGLELLIGNLDFGVRLLLGISIALIIAIAEIYFLAKQLNELDEVTNAEKEDFVPKAGEKFKFE